MFSLQMKAVYKKLEPYLFLSFSHSPLYFCSIVPTIIKRKKLPASPPSLSSAVAFPMMIVLQCSLSLWSLLFPSLFLLPREFQWKNKGIECISPWNRSHAHTVNLNPIETCVPNASGLSPHWGNRSLLYFSKGAFSLLPPSLFLSLTHTRL